MAGATGFLSSTPAYDLLWTRYADGSVTNLGRGLSQVRMVEVHGSVSDVVALEHGEIGDADHRVELHDMATGAVSTVALGKYRHFMGAVGSTVVTSPWTGGQNTDSSELHLLSIVNGVQTERTVTGLPSDTRTVGIASTAPGQLVLDYNRLTGAETDWYYAVVDLASGVATPSKLAPSTWADAALSPKYLATLQGPMLPATSQLRVKNRATGKVTQIDTHQRVTEPMVGLAGNWALFGSRTSLSEGSTDEDFAFRAVPVGGGASRKILDHATSLAPTPDGALLVMGGTLAQGEGVYRVSPGADGAPVAKLVAGTGQPLGITLVRSDVPAVATLDKAPWKARWQLSRPNADVTLTLRNTTTGASNTSHLNPSDNTTEPVRMDYNGRIRIDWTGWTSTGSAPNGNYTWQITAKPYNGLGPTLNVSGTFKVTRQSAPHDYTNNGSPDLLGRDSAGVLWRIDTAQYPWTPTLYGNARAKLGGGWNTYDQITAVGNIAGGSAGDLVARDSAGVLWLYQGTGKGTFGTRTRIGGGWNTYTQLIGLGDSNIDGKPDLLAIDQTGTPWRYRGTGNAQAPFATREGSQIIYPGHRYNTIV
ncbi:hypothetical protein ACFWAX_36915 [Streptomyces sp. NPDC059956]|uniref:hypothetical protein n=1 Tax=Streptomyces sp. NPDC059956 TaxID=3347015 RepID=UPI003652E036